MGQSGPLPSPVVRRRNKRVTSGKKLTLRRPAMPRDFEGEAKAEWQRIVPELHEAGLLTGVDRAVLMRYCLMWADWCRVRAELAVAGEMIPGKDGVLMLHPLWRVRTDAERTLTELARQLGLTPMARLRASIAHEKPSVQDVDGGPTVLDEYRAKLGGSG